MNTFKPVDRKHCRRPADKSPVVRLAALLARVAANDFVRQCGSDASADARGEMLTICTEFDGELPPVANDVDGAMPSISCQPEPRGEQTLELSFFPAAGTGSSSCDRSRDGDIPPMSTVRSE